MPCRSDYLEPNEREIESRETCKHLCYLLTALGQPVPEWVRNVAARVTGDRRTLRRSVPMLCAQVKMLSDDQLSALVYDGRIPQARKLADWWDRHQEADAKREAAEARRAERRKLRQQALAKLDAVLSAEERAALGF